MQHLQSTMSEHLGNKQFLFKTLELMSRMVCLRLNGDVTVSGSLDLGCWCCGMKPPPSLWSFESAAVDFYCAVLGLLLHRWHLFGSRNLSVWESWSALDVGMLLEGSVGEIS